MDTADSIEYELNLEECLKKLIIEEYGHEERHSPEL